MICVAEITTQQAIPPSPPPLRHRLYQSHWPVMRAKDSLSTIIGLQFVQRNGDIFGRLFTYVSPLVLKRWMDPLVGAKPFQVG